MKKNCDPRFNLQLFAEGSPADEIDLDLNLDDEIIPPVEDGGTPPEDGGTPPEDQSKWFMPGMFKTQKDAEKGQTKTKQYIKQLEAKNKELIKSKESTPLVSAIPDPGQEDNIDKAVRELGITEEDFVTDALKTNKKIMRYIEKTLIPAGIQPVVNIAGGIRAGIIKDKMREEYPNFDIDANEDKVAKVLISRYAPSYIKTHSLRLISAIIEEMGGKKGEKTSDIPFSEEPSGGSAVTKKRTAEGDSIRDSIKNAKVGTVDAFA